MRVATTILVFAFAAAINIVMAFVNPTWRLLHMVLATLQLAVVIYGAYVQRQIRKSGLDANRRTR